MKEKNNKERVKPDIGLLLYFGISVLTFGVGSVFFGYFAIKTGLVWLYIMSIGGLICLVGLLFYNKIFIDRPAEITEQGIIIGKKLTQWEDVEKVWPETIWTGRGEPHLFACFRIKDRARKKKPKNARFDFRKPVNDDSLRLIEHYMQEQNHT